MLAHGLRDARCPGDGLHGPVVLDLDALGLRDVMQYEPKTPRECALAEVDLIVAQWRPFLDGHADPLTHYGLDWLSRFAPESVARVSLVQGDTGPVNFMFQGDRVSAVIDWELGHFGDPMEDLGNIAVREGAWQGLWKKFPFLKKPFLRGGVVLLEALHNGISALRWAAEQAMEGEEEGSAEASAGAMTATLIFSILLAFGLFIALPHGITLLLGEVFAISWMTVGFSDSSW